MNEIKQSVHRLEDPTNRPLCYLFEQLCNSNITMASLANNLSRLLGAFPLDRRGNA